MDVSAIGSVPHGWRVARLGDLCEPPEYGAPAPARPFDPNLPRYIRITDLTDDGRLRTNDTRSADPALTLGFELQAGDLLFARSGATAGKTYLYQEEDGPCTYAGYLIRFRPIPTKAIPRFVELWTHSTFYKRWLASVSRIGAQPNINAAEYESLPVPVPPLIEQETIVLMISAICEAIESTESVIVSIEQLRDSLRHELLTLSIPGYDPDFREVQLSNVAEIVMGQSPKGESVLDWDRATSDNDGLPFIQGNFEFDTKCPNPSKWCVQPAAIAEPGDLLISVRAPVGETNIADQQIAIGHGLAAIRFTAADSSFGWHILNHIKGVLKRLAQGSTFDAIGRSDLHDLTFPLPPLAEQQTVAETLDSVDNAAEMATHLCATLRTLRQSIAEALLLGKLRLPIPGQVCA